jgi:hypothetical protein
VGKGRSLYVKSAAAKIFKKPFLPLVWVRHPAKTADMIVLVPQGPVGLTDFRKM